MHIARIQIEEGFLDGLDLKLSSGLNVLIGPRGSGKTSLIELIRYGLGAPGITERAEAVGEAHARSVLEGGQVTVTMRDEDREFVATRSADEDRPRISSEIVVPTVLSQNEIESIGISAAGRLRLLDEFRVKSLERQLSVELRRQDARTATVFVREISQNIDEIDEQIASLSADVAQLETQQREYHAQLEKVAAANSRQSALEDVTSRARRLSVEAGVYERALIASRTWREGLVKSVRNVPPLENWPSAAGSVDRLVETRAVINRSVDRISATIDELTNALLQLETLSTQSLASRVALEEEARAIRSELEELQQGSGALARRVADLQEKAGQSSAMVELRDQLHERRKELIAKRDSYLDEIELQLVADFTERNAVAQQLTRSLGRSIEVSVQQGGSSFAYLDAVLASLKGSGMKYGSLAQTIVARLSPRELVSAVERRDTVYVAKHLDIPLDRAARLVSEIGKGGTEAIVACELQDFVTLSLLDGDDYKLSDTLSTGQRCTAVLPLLLSKPSGVLVIDQPEDHLDNAFIVQTAVTVLANRSSTAQYLFSTHNPNIPVLGNADLVVHMGSDGRRGFVRSAARLSDAVSVSAITTVMEGGLDAFERRRSFYRGGASSNGA